MQLIAVEWWLIWVILIDSLYIFPMTEPSIWCCWYVSVCSGQHIKVGFLFFFFYLFIIIMKPCQIRRWLGEGPGLPMHPVLMFSPLLHDHSEQSSLLCVSLLRSTPAISWISWKCPCQTALRVIALTLTDAGLIYRSYWNFPSCLNSIFMLLFSPVPVCSSGTGRSAGVCLCQPQLCWLWSSCSESPIACFVWHLPGLAGGALCFPHNTIAGGSCGPVLPLVTLIWIVWLSCCCAVSVTWKLLFFSINTHVEPYLKLR